VSDCQESRKIDDRSGHCGSRNAIDFDDVVLEQIVAPMHGHSGKLVRRSRVNENRGNPSTQFRQIVQFSSSIVRCDSIWKRRHCGSHKVHRSRHIDDLVAEATEWLPPPVSNALIDLPLGESVFVDLTDADRPTLPCRGLGDCSIWVHVRNMPDTSIRF
jgi:hypothetical protein